MKKVEVFVNSKTVEVKPEDLGFVVLVTTNPNATFILSDYFAPMWEVDGNPGSPVTGQNTFQNSAFVGAQQLTFIIVNKTIEFLGEDFLFNSTTGTITRNNTWVIGDKMVTPYKKVS